MSQESIAEILRTSQNWLTAKDLKKLSDLNQASINANLKRLRSRNHIEIKIIPSYIQRGRFITYYRIQEE